MSGDQPSDDGWWSGSQYQQYWQDLRNVEDRMKGFGGHPKDPRMDRKRGKREAAYWKSVAAGLQFENYQLQRLGIVQNYYSYPCVP